MKHFITTLLFCLYYLTSGPVFAAPSEEEYRFERLWPTLPQPWYFDRAHHLAVDKQGYVYVTNQIFNQLRKFTADGHLVRQWFFDGEPTVVQASRKTDKVYVVHQGFSSTVHFFLSKIGVFNAAGEETFITMHDGEKELVQCCASGTLALDKDDNIYLLDTFVRYLPSGELKAFPPFLQKFDSTGQLQCKWPLQQPNDLTHLSELAIDSKNGVYFLYPDNRLLKYQIDDCNKPLRLVQQWAGFNGPSGITVDDQDHVYVADTNNHRVQKLSATTGQFENWQEKEWKVDKSGLVLSSEAFKSSPLIITTNSEVFPEIRKMLPEEVSSSLDRLMTLWQTTLDFSKGPQRFSRPVALAVGDQTLYVKVMTPFNETIQKYCKTTTGNHCKTTGNNGQEQGEFQTEWRSYNTGEGQVYGPFDIARDSQGHLYVVDAINHRVLKFSENGQFLSRLGKSESSGGIAEGEFILPLGIAVDNRDNVYVVDTGNLRIQQFDSQGQFVQQIGGITIPPEESSDTMHKFKYIVDNSKFLLPIDVAVDSHSNIYVVDLVRNRVLKFTSSGKPVAAFKESPLGKGILGDGDGEFKTPFNIAIDNHDNIFVVDSLNYRVQQFTTDGDYVKQWDHQCLSSANPVSVATEANPVSVATDNDGHLYVHTGAGFGFGHSIVKFNLNGTVSCDRVMQWGENGVLPGQFGDYGGIAVSPHGEQVFLADSDYNRIQVFKQGRFKGGKAIIVAGGGPGTKDNKNDLWDSTQAVANFAYRTLAYQGFTKETIYYLSNTTNFDLDGNGVNDDIDAVHTKANLESAITQWAADANDLILYLTDHGGSGSFVLNETDSVSDKELAGWLKSWQDKHPQGLLKIIYDACQSGSFKETLAGKNRIIITSAAPNESAYFLSQGALSFSNYFWTNIFNGLSISEAFTQAQETVAVGYKLLRSGQQQTPAMVAQVENLTQLYLGNGTKSEGKAPIITSVSASPVTKNTATITATVNNMDNIDRVWAIIVPPSGFGGLDFSTNQVVGQTVMGLPSCELSRAGGNLYQTDCDKFSVKGEYDVAIYARDSQQNTSIPKKLTLKNDSGVSRKAIIVVAGDEKTVANYQEIANSSKLVYEALRYQGYSQDNVYYMANAPINDVKDTAIRSTDRYNLVDGALKQWAQDNTQDLVIYLVGLGNDKGVTLNATETLTFAELKARLDTLQEQYIPGPVTVIYEGPQSGYLLPALQSPPTEKKRVVISSTGIPAAPQEEAPLLTFTFSKQFWQKIANGANVSMAFNEAHGARGETAQLDDNGDGSYNTNDESNRDGQVANSYTIGIGIVTAEQLRPCVHPLVPTTTTTCNRSNQIQVELPVLAAGQVQYIGIQTPNGNLLVIKALNRAVPFERLETMPVWEGTGKLALDIEANTVLPLGEYRFYRLEVPKGTLLKAQDLDKLEQSVLKIEE